ncbi:MAG: hypothetical protein VYA18_17645, partial [Pseudomonadota bacterium]|nr:hypothetical protein [Pseudomonadota bacterium]
MSMVTVAGMGVDFFLRDKAHSALRAIARFVLPDFRMHWTCVFNAVCGRFFMGAFCFVHFFGPVHVGAGLPVPLAASRSG